MKEWQLSVMVMLSVFLIMLSKWVDGVEINMLSWQSWVSLLLVCFAVIISMLVGFIKGKKEKVNG
jgi:hypothetical protein